MNSGKLNGRAVLVTGANRGLGRALVEEALRRGAKRVYAGTRQPLAYSDGHVTPLTLDVTNAAQIQGAVEKVGNREVVVPERLVYTFEWEGMPGRVLIETITFEERPGGKTRVTATDLFPTAEGSATGCSSRGWKQGRASLLQPGRKDPQGLCGRAANPDLADSSSGSSESSRVRTRWTHPLRGDIGLRPIILCRPTAAPPAPGRGRLNSLLAGGP